MPINILIVDDNALIRIGLRQHLGVEEDFTVVGEAVNGREAVDRAQALQPDVIVMDVSMPEMDGIEAAGIICRRLPKVRILILSMHNSAHYCLHAMRSGARGYALKESAGEEVVTAIRTLMEGRTYFGAGLQITPEGVGALPKFGTGRAFIE